MLVRLLNWSDSDHASYSIGSDSESGLDAVSCATAIAVEAFADFVAVLPQLLVSLQYVVPLHCDVPALLPIVSLLPRDEPVMLPSLFAPLRSGTSWDRIRSSFLRVMEPIRSPLLG